MRKEESMNTIHIFLAEEKQRLTHNLKKYEEAIQIFYAQTSFQKATPFDANDNTLFVNINELTPESRMRYEWIEQKRIESKTKLHIFYNILLQYTQSKIRSQYHFPLGDRSKQSLSCDQIAIDHKTMEILSFNVQAGPVTVNSPKEMPVTQYIHHYHTAFNTALWRCIANEVLTREEEDEFIRESCTSFFQSEILKKEKGHQKNMQ